MTSNIGEKKNKSAGPVCIGLCILDQVSSIGTLRVGLPAHGLVERHGGVPHLCIEKGQAVENGEKTPEPLYLYTLTSAFSSNWRANGGNRRTERLGCMDGGNGSQQGRVGGPEQSVLCVVQSSPAYVGSLEGGWPRAGGQGRARRQNLGR